MTRAPILKGLDRDKLRTAMDRDYTDGMTVRELCDKYGRSYGTCHKLLQEAGTEMRLRGGFHGRH